MGNCLPVSCSVDAILIRCWDFISGPTNYIGSLEENLGALDSAQQQLRARRDDVWWKVQLEAGKPSMKPLNQVLDWLSKAKTMIADAEKLIRDSPEEKNKLCLGGYFSQNCTSSWEYAKKVADKHAEINVHISKGEFQRFAELEPAGPVEVRPIELITLQGSIFYQAWSSIRDKNTGIIGLYGLGGVGKTTLLTHINNKFSTTPPIDIDIVIWVVVSKDYTVGNLQDKVGEKMGFSDESWKNKTVDQKAISISGFLHKKRFVLLMDDLWERVDLTKVGIPIPNKENGSKLVFTTRFLEVCGEMGAQKKIKVECLNPEQAWELFQEKVGDETLNHPEIRELAKQVAKQCGGLPIALITIGRAMSCKNKPEDWEYAIKMLHRSAFPKLEKEVYPLLKFSYDSLPDTMKCCFLYCCLYPEDHTISRKSLVEYWFCEGLLNEFDRVSEARLQGYSIINSLCSACLLESADEGCVKMHDVIRDMALWIACELEAEEKKFFAKAGVGLTKAPEARKWEGVRRMSLMENRVEHLTETPTCPNLQTLLLGYNRLKVIGDSFFQCMSNLRVLNLSFNRGLRELPEGVSELVSLECLDLSVTSITELSIKLKSLKNLKVLDLAYTPELRRIPRHLISSFSKLQIFRLTGQIFPRDYPEIDNILTVDGACLLMEELKCLEHLNGLSIQIHTASDLQILSFLRFEGYIEELYLNFLESKVLNVISLPNMNRVETLQIVECGNMEEIKLERIQIPGFPTSSFSFKMLSKVGIRGCHKLRDLTWLILAPNLISLSVVRCSEMEEIMSEEKLSEVADVVGSPCPCIFDKLQLLHLHSLPELKSIYWDALPFPRLNNITVWTDCMKLKKLPLNSESAKGNQLMIIGPQVWWEMVEWTDEATRDVFLPSFFPLETMFDPNTGILDDLY
ncbi:hypothetical protein V6N11_048936 [Hibiscus sabdariffa]|uniref:NB-ARC domain-containing protein n=1 Tax=Hibiscus sabdariffa TaxID=183260 RepID=A0ABR2PWX9_9ROSI